MPQASELKRNVRFLHEGTPFVVWDVATQTPSARGSATLVKVSARDLLTGQLKSFTFKAAERLEDPDIEMRRVQYLYNDGETWVFMDSETYEQLELTRDGVGDAARYLTQNLGLRLMTFNGRPVSIEIPKAMDMKVVECEFAIKGDTVRAVTKGATLESGLVVQVPLFVNPGDVIRVDTAEGRYVERVKLAGK